MFDELAVITSYSIHYTKLYEMKNSQMMLPTVFHAQINTTTYYIGLIPGLLSTVIGAMLAGIGIYKRQTATLFKELEN